MEQCNNYLIARKKSPAAVVLPLKENQLDLTGKPEGKEGLLYRVCHLQGWIHQAEDFFIVTGLQTNDVIDHIIHLQRRVDREKQNSYENHWDTEQRWYKTLLSEAGLEGASISSCTGRRKQPLTAPMQVLQTVLQD